MLIGKMIASYEHSNVAVLYQYGLSRCKNFDIIGYQYFKIRAFTDKDDPLKLKYSALSNGLNHLIFRPRRSVKSLPIEPLDIVKLHDSIIILTPPPLSLPLVEHLSAAK